MSRAQPALLLDDHDGRSVVALMYRLLPCEWITLASGDPATRRSRLRNWPGAMLQAAAPGEFARLTQSAPSTDLPLGSPDGGPEHPVLRWLRRHPRAVDPLRLSPAEAIWSDGAHNARDQPAGPPGLGRSLLVVPLSAESPWLAAWLLTRSDAEFGLPELDVARLIAPGLRQRWNLGRLRHYGVTGRELQVLQLVAAGLTATAVARRCGISARTVHKHLENAYAKLGCHDRLTAVLILQEAGLLGHRAEAPA